MGKRPAILLYTGDWLRDTALRSCSPIARSMWIDMICFMHDCEPYGYLKVGTKVILPINLSSMVGLTISETEGCLKELLDSGVCSKAEDGTLYSARMVRDEEIRLKRATGGHSGGNPQLKKGKKVIQNNVLKDNSKVDEEVNLSLENDNNNEDDIENEITGGGAGGGRLVNPVELLTAKEFLSAYGTNTEWAESRALLITGKGKDFTNPKAQEWLLDWLTVFVNGEIINGTGARAAREWATHFKNWFGPRDTSLNPKDFKNGIINGTSGDTKRASSTTNSTSTNILQPGNTFFKRADS